ncbi:retinoic acid receptor gamma-A isoform X1, partial [Tachysurus ichikawai]
MATNRSHMPGFPAAVYPFAFNSMRSHSPFDLMANGSLFGRFGADLPKEMAAL